MDVWMLAMGVVAMVAVPSAIWTACAAVKGLVEPKYDYSDYSTERMAARRAERDRELTAEEQVELDVMLAAHYAEADAIGKRWEQEGS